MTTLNQTVSLGTIIEAASLAFVAVGLLLNWWQFRRDGQSRRGEFVMRIYDQFNSDAVATDLYYKILDGEFKFTKDFWESKEAAYLDGYLYHLDCVAQLHERRLLNDEDLGLLRFDLIQFCRDEGVHSYCERVRELYRKQQLDPAKLKPFGALTRVGKKLESRYRLPPVRVERQG
jgi:hypothetical protein